MLAKSWPQHLKNKIHFHLYSNSDFMWGAYFCMHGYNHNAVVVIKIAAYVYSWCILSMAAYYYNFMVVHLIDTKSKQCGSVLIICG